MSAFPVPVPQRGQRVGESASLLKHRAAIVRRVPGKQREDEHHHTKPGGGAATRGRWLRAGVAGRSLDAGSWQFVSPPGGSSRVRDLFRILLLNPVESCPPRADYGG